MKILIMVLLIASVAMLAVVTGISRSHSGSTIGRAGTTSTSILRDLQSSSTAHQLAAEDFDDRSLVFPRETKH
jgi:hypothetical protein